MLYNSFGYSRMGLPTPVDEMLEKVTEGLDSMTAQLLLRESYETLYGIFDHERFGDSRPLALVAMHPKENASEYSALYRMVYRYKHHNVGELFRLNLVEFLNQPPELVELMFKISVEHSKAETPKIERALRGIEKSQQA